MKVGLYRPGQLPFHPLGAFNGSVMIGIDILPLPNAIDFIPSNLERVASSMIMEVMLLNVNISVIC